MNGADPAWRPTELDAEQALLYWEQHADSEYKAEVEANPVLRLGARTLTGVSTDPPPPLYIDRLDPEGHTVLYGTGGAGKGTLASWWIVRLVREGGRVLIADYENHPTEWARRIAGLGGLEELDSVIHVAPLTAAWGGVRGPLWQQASELRELALDMDATYMVVHSLVPACAGTDPLKPEAAALYAGGLEFIGLPALSLAHVTKTEDLRYPFGSAFWHNLARTTWSIKRDGERAMLTHRKHNNYAGLGRFVLTTTFRDDRPVEVWEQGYNVVLADRIDEALADDTLTVAQLVERLNEELDDEGEPVKTDSIGKTLRRWSTGIDRRYDVAGTGKTATWKRVSA